jgi:hypothetical protein
MNMTRHDDPRTPRWLVVSLKLAGLYNLLWGALVIAFPNVIFAIANLDPPRYPQIWQCVGMIVGVYGVGYLIAARDPARHWPIVLVGLLGKILGAIGFLQAVIMGTFPWTFGLTIITNDLIWWVPFVAILYHAFSVAQNRGRDDRNLTEAQAIEDVRTAEGASIADLSADGRVLLVFLRHAGCTFCRETLADLAEHRRDIESAGARIVLVHMGDDEQGAEQFGSFGLGDLPRISDPGRAVYRAFGLERGRVGLLFGPRVCWRGIGAVLRGHRVGPGVGDGFQMPGLFLVEHGRVVRAIRHVDVAERPDYLRFVAGESGNETTPRSVRPIGTHTRYAR